MSRFKIAFEQEVDTTLVDKEVNAEQVVDTPVVDETIVTDVATTDIVVADPVITEVSTDAPVVTDVVDESPVNGEVPNTSGDELIAPVTVTVPEVTNPDKPEATQVVDDQPEVAEDTAVVDAVVEPVAEEPAIVDAAPAETDAVVETSVDPTGVDTDIPSEPTLAEAAAGASDAVTPEDVAEALEDPEELNADVDVTAQKQSMEEAIVGALDAADRIDTMVELNNVVSKIEEPTGTEMALINIANSLANGNVDTPMMSQEDFSDIGKAVSDKIKSAASSITTSIFDIFSSFGIALKRIGFAFKSHKAQLSKLQGIVDKITKDCSKDTVTISVKQTDMLFKGETTGKIATPVEDSSDLAGQMGSLSYVFDTFCNALAEGIVLQKSRYLDAFKSIFNKEATDALFMDELNYFNDKFVKKLIANGQLKHKATVGLLSINYSDVCLGGMHFEVSTPNANILKEKDVSIVLKALDNYSFGPNSFYKDISAGTQKRRDILINIADIKKILNSVSEMLTIFETITSKYVVNAVEELENFSSGEIRAIRRNADGEVGASSVIDNVSDTAQEIFKNRNKVARLQVLEARAIVEGYFNTYEVLNQYITDTITLVFDVANSKEWYNQDISSL